MSPCNGRYGWVTPGPHASPGSTMRRSMVSAQLLSAGMSARSVQLYGNGPARVRVPNQVRPLVQRLTLDRSHEIACFDGLAQAATKAHPGRLGSTSYGLRGQRAGRDEPAARKGPG